MTRVHIRTDDEVYRVDAVWLGPPRATFPWRARYSAYGVGLLVMLAVMFVQRRLGIPIGFFSVAWALLITVGITRFVSRRINDERPLLEWLTLFVHELRGPRAKQRVVGGPLTTDHVAVRRDRPKLTGAPTAIALPRGSDPVERRQVRSATADAAAAWGPPPQDGEVVTPTPAPAGEDAVPPAEHLTPGLDEAAGSHRRSSASRRSASAPRRSTPKARRAGDGFGPPSSTDVGDPVTPPASTPGPDGGPAQLPPVPDPRPGEAAVAAWTGGRAVREPVARRAARPRPDAVPAADPDRTQRRHVRPRRRPGWPMSNSPAAEPGAPFGPGSRRGGGRGDTGAAPR
ncbi:hypothetical protein GCM10023200_53430 [Actinomycetospora chlora]|uniref:PrgI family protein n=1 Tax=Actinomycetospora chlora TaxID=663608 RepID=A0ABP9CHK7_9PSEU